MPDSAAADPLSRRSVRQALRHWASSPALGQHPLALLPLTEAHRVAAGYRSTAVGRGVALRGILLRAIRSLATSDADGSAGRRAAILRGRYLEGSSAAYLTDHLGIARSTYDHEHAAALDALADRLREWSERGPPAELIAAAVPRPPVRGPVLVPPLPDQPIVGREELLEACRRHLLGPRRRLALAGLPGVGKSALAVVLAHDVAVRQAYPDGVLWAGLGKSPDLEARLGAWAVALGWSLETLASFPAPEDRARVIQAALAARRMLLVLDDAWTVPHAQALQLGGEASAHLITTRLPGLAAELAGGAALVVPELDPDASRQVLGYFAAEVVAQDPEAVGRLLGAVGGLPLALVLMGRHLRMEARLAQARRLQAALERLHEPAVRLDLGEARPALEAQPSLSLDAPLTLRRVVALSDAALPESARWLLAALAVLPPKPSTFSEAMALAVSGEPQSALDALVDAGLVEPGGEGRFAVHPVVADYAASLGGAPQAANRFIDFVAALPSQAAGDWAAHSKDQANALAALQLAERLGTDEALIRLTHAWAPTFEATGRLEPAAPWLERAVEAARRLGHPDLLVRALADRARTALHLGMYDQATACAEEGLSLALAAGDPALACACLKVLSLAALSRGEYAAARTFSERGLELVEASGLASDRAALLANLGSIDVKQSWTDRAEAHYAEALAIARSIGDRRMEASLLANLGVLAAQRGATDDAEPLFLEALELAGAAGDRPAVASVLTNLGALAHERGDEAAEGHFREALAIARELGDPARQAQLLANLGRLAVARGDLEEADGLYTEGLALARRTGHRENLVQLLVNSSALARLDGRPAEARAALEEALALAGDLGHARFLAAAQAELAKLSPS